MDTKSQADRSRNMSAIKSKDTQPELIVRRFLHSNGFRYRLHKNTLPGKPDIVLKKYSATIFVHGCFWHHHKGCKRATWPKTNQDYWKPKIEKNIRRDKENTYALRKLGWNIIVIWECQLKSNMRDATLSKLSRRIEQVNL